MIKQISEIFSKVTDYRVKNRCSHQLVDILFIGLCTLLSNGEDFEDMVEFGKEREPWLRKYIELENGIPSKDTFNRVLQMIDSEELNECLGKDGAILLASIGSLEGNLINIDGKKLKGYSPTSRGNKGLFLLNAWVSEHRLCIGQEKVEGKSNEITAIPQLLDKIAIKGSTVSIDAIGCQSKIAEKIVDKEADYLLAVKENQGNLLKEVRDPWIWECENSKKKKVEQWEYDHGRYEVRRCQIADAKHYLSPNILSNWKGLQTLVKIEATRTINNVTTTKTRYYISSEQKNRSTYNEMVRRHWGIENQLHWHLDVTFKEDASRSRSGNAPQNLAILRKIALHRLSQIKDKRSLKKRRYRASMNTQYLEQILKI